MAYLCQNCGAVADDSHDLCNPVDEEPKRKLCGTSIADVCDEKLPAMKYTCSCGSVSENPEHLCNPHTDFHAVSHEGLHLNDLQTLGNHLFSL